MGSGQHNNKRTGQYGTGRPRWEELQTQKIWKQTTTLAFGGGHSGVRGKPIIVLTYYVSWCGGGGLETTPWPPLKHWGTPPTLEIFNLCKNNLHPFHKSHQTPTPGDGPPELWKRPGPNHNRQQVRQSGTMEWRNQGTSRIFILKKTPKSPGKKLVAHWVELYN